MTDIKKPLASKCKQTKFAKQIKPVEPKVQSI